jgi:hypothetical protein
MPIKIPAEVKKGLDVIRGSGLTNMLDYPKVMQMARDLGYFDTVDWLHVNKSSYGKGIFEGFEVSEDE